MTTQAKNLIEKYLKTQSTYSIDYEKMEEITQEIYGKSIEIFKRTNDTTYRYIVEQNHSHSQKELQKTIINGGCEEHYFGYILNDMFEKGFIPSGIYYIYVSW